jgi:hypothetical protein
MDWISVLFAYHRNFLFSMHESRHCDGGGGHVGGDDFLDGDKHGSA